MQVEQFEIWMHFPLPSMTSFVARVARAYSPSSSPSPSLEIFLALVISKSVHNADIMVDVYEVWSWKIMAHSSSIRARLDRPKVGISRFNRQ